MTKIKYTITRGECNHAISITAFQSNKIILLAFSPELALAGTGRINSCVDLFYQKGKLSWKPLNTVLIAGATNKQQS